MPEIISRTDALRLGLNKYFTGEPCKSGHVAERKTKSCHCCKCATQASAAWGMKDLERRRKDRAAYHARKPEVKKAYRLRSKYGISLEDHERMFEAQGKCCAICRSGDPGSYGRWNTDHCHTTGKVRGIVCHPCNLALGFARDSVSTLRSMIAYLEKSAMKAEQGAA